MTHSSDESGRLAELLGRLLQQPGTRVEAGELGDERLAQAFNQVAERFDASREAAAALHELRESMGALSDTLLGIAQASFTARAPRTYRGDTLDVLAYLVNATAEEVEQLVMALRQERGHLERTHARLLASEKLAALGRLAASVAHELNQPLSVIVNMLDVMRLGGGAWAAEQRSSLELMERAAEQMRRIVDDMLRLGRPTTCQLSPTDALGPLQAAVRLVGGDLRHQGIDLRVEAPRDVPAVVADAARLQQVFVNLLRNAKDALLEAKPNEPEIRVRVEWDDTRVSYLVEDNGLGVTPEHAEQLFEPFFTTRSNRGTGLGLSISLGIVEEHGGELRYEGRPEGGARFVASIPRAS